MAKKRSAKNGSKKKGAVRDLKVMTAKARMIKAGKRRMIT